MDFLTGAVIVLFMIMGGLWLLCKIGGKFFGCIGEMIKTFVNSSKSMKIFYVSVGICSLIFGIAMSVI